ncbi:signal peptidase II [Agromyces sp. H3Y2-19a]|uniref:signal peptidase II n=1 Tax=Agromyces TaxID=33877 RepID=UPI001E4D4EF4|nr:MULTISPECIES: signal peptidase II [Agromyces]MCD5345828.1 signal peptidase II [Agromyces sp. S2-1-8]MDF0512193.1 signal peptidase II [Agromyces chromiiresistens]
MSSDPAAPGDAPTDAGPAAAREPAASGRRLFWWVIAIAVVVVVVDQASKWWAVAELGDGTAVPVIGDLIRFVLVYNPGAAFSIGTEHTWIFAILAGVGAVAVAWYAWRVRSVGWTIALGLLLGGAVTHLGDRLFREPGFGRGHVVDFIGYGDWFIGNVADIAIFAGAVMILVLTLMGVSPKGGRTRDA